MILTGAFVLAGESNKLYDGEHVEMAHEASQSSFRPIIEEIQKILFFLSQPLHIPGGRSTGSYSIPSSVHCLYRLAKSEPQGSRTRTLKSTTQINN